MDWGVDFFIVDDIGSIHLRIAKVVQDKKVKGIEYLKTFIVTLNGVILKERPNEEIEQVIAHELAHMIRMISMSKNYEENVKYTKAEEKIADKIAEKWGFYVP